MKKELLRIDNGQLKLSLYEALNGVYMNLLAGEALGVIFANLNEKEALIKVLRADAAFSSGRMYVNENAVTGTQIVRQNIYVISRGTTMSERLNICENIFFTMLPPLMLNLAIYREMLTDLLEQFDVDVDIERPIQRLTHGQHIALELIKAYVHKKKIVVLADLTSYLTPDELDGVLAIAARMKREGFGFVMIESFWDVMFKHTENIAIIQYGKTTGLFRTSELGVNRLKSALWQDLAPGEAAPAAPKHFNSPPGGDNVLEFNHVHTDVLSDLSFSLRKGELMKVLYLDERSRAHFLELLRAQRRPARGEILLRGRPYRPSSRVRDAQRQGLCIVEDNPQEKMLFHNMSVFDNLAILLTGRVKGLWLDARYRNNLRATARELCGEDLWNIPIGKLTPMQLQKLTYCKWLILHPALIVCINPFTGMDYQVDDVTGRMLTGLLSRGTAVLILASYLPESAPQGKLYYLENGSLKG